MNRAFYMTVIAIINLTMGLVSNAWSQNHTINLNVAYKTVYFAGHARKAIAVNNQIPAPTLHFRQGDTVNINVYNSLKEETAIHWHGLLVPWQMDGVLGVTQHGIQPGKIFHYKFKLEQSGTYWYHAHAGLQEQEGLYGAFVIDPIKPEPFKYTKDYVIVLSDWSNTSANQIFANLKKEGDYYSPNFPLQPSLMKFIHDYRKANAQERKLLIDDYKMMQQMRMSIYDINDVAYDAFLMNGHPKSHPWIKPVNIGDVVRLRFIGAGASTIFRVKINNTIMQMVHVQGNDVRIYNINSFTVAPGETYDVLVKINANTPYIIYAESTDTVGAAYGALATSENQYINFQNVQPFPEPLPVTREMMTNMMSSMDHGSMSSMNMQMNNQSTLHSKMTEHTGHNVIKMNQSQKNKKSNNHSKHTIHSQNAINKIKKDSNKNNTEQNPMSNMDMNSHNLHEMPATQNETPDINSQPSSLKKMTPYHDMSNMNMPMDQTNNQIEKPHNELSVKNNKEKMNNASSTSMTSGSGENTSTNSSKMVHDMSNMQMPMEALQKKKSRKENISNEMSSMSMPNMPMDHAKHNMSSMGQNNMQMNHGMSMNHSMDMPTEPTITNDSILSGSINPSKTFGTKYQELTASVKTNDPNLPVSGTIKMELFGYMDRFIWFINGVPEYLAKPIKLDPAKRYRFVFINNSMMHHPMHIHGHWFILRNGHGSYDSLLHTIDVPPGSTVTADVDTDASGQWFFHCHMLYHMFAGMGRVFQYSTLIEITKGETQPQNIVQQTAYHNRPIVRVDEVRPIETSLVNHPMPHPMGLFLATFLDVGIDPFHNVQKLTYKGLYGRDWDKLELFTDDAEVKEGKVDEANIDIFYWRLISQFWAIKGGVNYFYRPAQTPYWQPGIGIEGLMPYFIDTNLRAYYYSGSAKLDAEFSRDTQITNNFFLRLGIRGILASKTVSRAEIGSGLNQMRYIIRPYYRVMPGLNVFAEYEYEKNYGDFRKLQIADGDSASENTITFGLSVLF